MEADYDICVIGGGINGAGIVRDAQGRGHRTLLVEAQDLAGATSSCSTKLVHGGLRYLEHYKFKLVRESLLERARLISIAPHIIWPMDFVLPVDEKQRPAWMIRAGMMLYDRLAGSNNIRKSRSVDFATDHFGDPLLDHFEKGFVYADCWVDDARLVALNALDAKERGADILTRTAVLNISPRKDETGWRVTLLNIDSGDEFRVTARAVVNAAGPWVRKILEASGLADHKTPLVRLVKGSHIVIPKIHGGQQSYLLQQPDGRVVFAIPYEHDFTLVGTTDMPFHDDAATAQIEPLEIDYLLNAVNNAFKVHVTPQHVVWTYSGVRALADDGEANSSKVTRDYKLDLRVINKAPILSVFGGKITTYRHLAEVALNKLTRQDFSWTAAMPLPGGNIRTSIQSYIDDQAIRYPFLPLDLVRRYARSYGTRMDKFIEGKYAIQDMGIDFEGGVYQAEIDYLIAHEFVKTPDDLFWRRSKLGLHVSQQTVNDVTDYMAKR